MVAPNFSLPDENNQIHNLTDYRDKWVLVYFYPKDDTPGCTREACNFRDHYTQLQKLGVQIIGISKDSVASHLKFKNKYNLNFPLLSDESKETIKAFGAWGVKKFMGRTFEGVLRKSFLIDPTGEIKKTYDKVNPLTHATEIIKDLSSLTYFL